MSVQYFRREIEELLETPEAFREWLSRRESFWGIRFLARLMPAGRAANGEDCPLNRFLAESGFDVWRVSTFHMHFEEDPYPVVLSPWARAFVYEFDSRYPEDSRVSYRQCLKLLDEIEHDFRYIESVPVRSSLR